MLLFILIPRISMKVHLLVLEAKRWIRSKMLLLKDNKKFMSIMWNKINQRFLKPTHIFQNREDKNLFMSKDNNIQNICLHC